MHGSRIAQFPPTWKDISVLSRKKKSTRSYYSTIDREMGLTPTADYATRNESPYNT